MTSQQTLLSLTSKGLIGSKGVLTLAAIGLLTLAGLVAKKVGEYTQGTM